MEVHVSCISDILILDVYLNVFPQYFFKKMTVFSNVTVFTQRQPLTWRLSLYENNHIVQRRDFQKYDCRNAKSTHSQVQQSFYRTISISPYHFCFTVSCLFCRKISILPCHFCCTVSFLFYRTISILPYLLYLEESRNHIF